MATSSELDEDEDPWDLFEPMEINYYLGSTGTGPEPLPSAIFGTATFPYRCPSPDATQSSEPMFAPPASETAYCATTSNWPSQSSGPIPSTNNANPNYLSTVEKQPGRLFDAFHSPTSSSRERAVATLSRPTKPLRRTNCVSRKRQKRTGGSVSYARLQDVCPYCQSACAGGCELRRQTWSIKHLPSTSHLAIEQSHNLPYPSDGNKTIPSSFLPQWDQQGSRHSVAPRVLDPRRPFESCTRIQSPGMNFYSKSGSETSFATIQGGRNIEFPSGSFDSLLACPFYKNDPLRYCDADGRYRTCQQGYKNFTHLVYHFQRIHMAPIHCLRCKSLFGLEKDLKIHLRRKEGCSLDLERVVDGITKDQFDEIITNTIEVQDEVEKWKIMYTVLFPGCYIPDPLLPWDSGCDYAADFLEMYRLNEFPKLLAKRQLEPLESTRPPLRVIVRDIVKKYAAVFRIRLRARAGGQAGSFNQTAIFTTPQNFWKDGRDLSTAADTSRSAHRDFATSPEGFGNLSSDLQFHQTNRECGDIVSSFVGPAIAQLENSVPPNAMVNYTNYSSWGQSNNAGSANLNSKLENNNSFGCQPKGSTGDVLFSEPIPYDQEPRLESRDKQLKSSLDPDTDRRWACHYHKFDRLKYCINKKTGNRYKTCPGGFSCFRFLKEHLYGSNDRGRHIASHVCMKCLTTFCSESSLNSHRQAQECIQSNEPLGSIGVTPAHKEQFKLEVREAKSDEERWQILYRILFPGKAVPSPYVEPDEVQSEIELHMASFKAFQTASLPQLLSEKFAAEFDILPVAERRRHIEAIVNCVTQTFMNWNARGNPPHENSTIATQTEDSFQTRGASLSQSLAPDNQTWSNFPDVMEDIVPQLWHSPSSQRVDAPSQATANFDSPTRLSGSSALQQNYPSGSAVQQEAAATGIMWQPNYDQSRTGVRSVPDAMSSGHVLGDSIGFDPDAVSENFGWAQL